VEEDVAQDGRCWTDCVHGAAANKSLQGQIEATDQEIETLVYELYALTEEELAIVEGRDH
jgi:hypothetical protein